MKFLRNFWLPILLSAILIGGLNFGKFVPIEAKQLLLSISLIIKEIILLFLPFIIIILLINSISNLQERAIGYFFLLVVFIICSNFIAANFGYLFFKSVVRNAGEIVTSTSQEPLSPAFKTQSLQIITNAQALIIGCVLGLILSYYRKPHLIAILEHWQDRAVRLLKIFMIPAIPILIVGFVLKMEHENIITTSITSYGKVLFYFCLAQAIYTIVFLLIISRFSLKNLLNNIGTILPASIMGFSTFSSIATMPVTIQVTEKILHNPSIARLFIPATVNIHLLGTIVGMNIIIFSCLGHEVSYMQFLPFAMYYVITMFSVFAIPGGSIFALAPIIENYLGVSQEVIALITTLVLVFDPIDTSFNITLNSIFAKVFEAISNSKKFFKGD